MNHSIKMFCAVAPALLIAHEAHADGWRCMDEPGQQLCQDALINDIESTTIARWPATLTVAMAPLPYTCTKAPGSGHQVFPGVPGAGGAAGAGGAMTNLSSSLSWSLSWAGAPRSFLLGTSTADADLAGTATVFGSSIATASVGGTTINYVFAPSLSEVGSPQGATGVADLGTLVGVSPVGSFWTSSLSVTLNLVDGDWTCLIGPSGKTVKATGRNTVRASYPIAWTSVQDKLAEATRDQYRSAVRLVVTGTP